MKSKAWLWFIALLLLSTGMLHAQTACPPGMIPYGAGVCGYDDNQQQPMQEQLQQSPHWLDQWGAIATDFSHGSAGAAVNRPSRSNAEHAALAECQLNGGSTCKIEIWYVNQCVALVIGDKIHNTRAGITLDDAIQAGIKKCSEEDIHCHAYYSSCSLPRQI